MTVARERPLRRVLGTTGLVFVMYFNVSGGPFTTEDLVARIGPGLALCLLLLVPLIWSLPEALIVGELASMLPEEGGYYRWVYRAFGPMWAFQNGWWTWMYSLVDMAIYPVLFNQYLGFFAPNLPPAVQWAISLVVIWGAAAINLRGALDVGRVSIGSGVFVLGCFALVTAGGFAHASHAPWHPITSGARGTWGSLGVGLSIALWNYIGWDNASTVQGEIRESSRSYPRALAITLPLVAMSYLLPVSASLMATDWHTWGDGSWPAIARAVMGPGGGMLAAGVAVAGMVSALALFNALLLSYSRIPLAMAGDALLPRWLGRLDGRSTPRRAVLVSAAAYSIFALLPFAKLVVADVLLYAMALFLEFAALIALRRRAPHLRGPFRIPLGVSGVVVLALLPAAVLLLVTGLELKDGEYGLPAVLGSLLIAAFGFPVYVGIGRFLRKTAIR